MGERLPLEWDRLIVQSLSSTSLSNAEIRMLTTRVSEALAPKLREEAMSAFDSGHEKGKVDALMERARGKFSSVVRNKFPG